MSIRHVMRLSATHLLILVIVGSASFSARAGTPEVERYVFSSESGFLRARLVHENGGFGLFSAHSRVRVVGEGDYSRLLVRVWRRPAAGESVPELRVERVEVRGYDRDGAAAFSQDVGGFSFGADSAGSWIEDPLLIPASVTRLEISFVGVDDSVR